MTQTKSGGQLAKEKMLAKNPDYYRELGRKGAAAYNAKPKEERKPRGFATMSMERHSEISSKGGSKFKSEYKKRVKHYAETHNQETN